MNYSVNQNIVFEVFYKPKKLSIMRNEEGRYPKRYSPLIKPRATTSPEKYI